MTTATRARMAGLALATACTGPAPSDDATPPTPTVDTATADACVPFDPGLSLTAPPLRPGVATEVAIAGAAPGAAVTLYRSTRPPGIPPCDPAWGDRRLDLIDAVSVGEAIADAAGVAVVALPDDLPAGTTVWLQAVAPASATGSAPVEAAVSTGLPPAGTRWTVDGAEATFRGYAPGDLLGDNLAHVGDVDGDGRDDVLIGAKEVDLTGANAGAVFVWTAPPPGERTADSATAILLGESAGDFAGGGLAGAGDVDGDGFDDILIGAKLSNAGGNQSGAAYLVRGPPPAQASLAQADARLVGEAARDLAGGTVAGPGDLNGDGFDDLLVGARDESSVYPQNGAVYLLFGPVSGEVDLGSAAAKVTGEGPVENVGGSIDGLGDTDGDGRADFAVCGCAADVNGVVDAGAVYVFTALPTGTVGAATAAARVHGATPGAFAASVAGVGDWDGDGYDDLLVGAPGDTAGGPGAGAAHLLRGPLTGDVSVADADATWTGSAGAQVGFAVDGLGDADGDGRPDAVVGAFGDAAAGTAAGAAYWIAGGTFGWRPLDEAAGGWLGAAAGDETGQAVAGPGDVDGDGYADVLIGAHAAAGAGPRSGAAYLWRGGPGW